MRMYKGWSQEEMADKLHMALSGYAKIERGKTDVNYSRLQQIANIFEVELSDLVGLNEKSVLNFFENTNSNHISNVNVSIHESNVKQEIEMLRLVNEQQAKEIDYLKEIIHLLKTGERIILDK
ncbi:MAG: helix-turn-helix transcriptional regulator [Thiomargarita sp.]|nr:helix-turn-helix transcriptional regulator [Thiomargarita sp.]